MLVTHIPSGYLHPKPSAAPWLTSTYRFLRSFQGFSRLVKVLKGLTVIPVQAQRSSRNLRIFLKLACLFPTQTKEVTAAMPETRRMEMLCITCKEWSPNSLAGGCEWVMRFVFHGDLQAHLTQVSISGIFMRSLQRLSHLCLQREMVGYLKCVLVCDLLPWSSSLAGHT